MYLTSHPQTQDGETSPVFFGVKLDDWILGALAFSIACVIGPIVAGVWVSLALLGRKGGNLLYASAVKVKMFTIPHGLDTRTAEAAILASGPLLMAFSDSADALTIALAAISALGANTILRHSSTRAALFQLAPLLCAATIVLLRSLWLGEIQALVIATWLGLGVGLCAAACQRFDQIALRTTMLTQALKDALPPSSALWEMDFRTRELKGADQFAQLLGRPINFDDLAAHRLGAPSEERDLVADLFAPRDGATRFVFLVHEARAGNGRALRLQHRGILHADASGTPMSLSCVTIIAEANRHGLTLADQWGALRAHYGLAGRPPKRLDDIAAAPLRQIRRKRA